jgi:hypothetical protein
MGEQRVCSRLEKSTMLDGKRQPFPPPLLMRICVRGHVQPHDGNCCRSCSLPGHLLLTILYCHTSKQLCRYSGHQFSLPEDTSLLCRAPSHKISPSFSGLRRPERSKRLRINLVERFLQLSWSLSSSKRSIRFALLEHTLPTLVLRCERLTWWAAHG